MIQFLGMENGGFRPNVVTPAFESNVRRVSLGQSGQGDGFTNFQHDELDDDHDEVPEVSESNWSVPPISCRDTRSKFDHFYIDKARQFYQCM